MKPQAKSYLIQLLFVLFLSISFIAASTKKVNNTKVSIIKKDTTENSGDPGLEGSNDTTDVMTGDPTIFNPNDLSSAFNESGYMTSNSVSFDGKEMINDFNGNLMYQIPLAKSKGQGDISLDVSLTYNGNVSYQIITSNKVTLSMQGASFRMYNITAPGWIYSVNGFAVQMLNFESSFFTNPHAVGTLNEVTGGDVHMLASGYQLTDNFNYAHAVSYRDKITIMLGDGSTMTLVNDNTNDQMFTPYTGYYRTTEKNSNIYAYVEFSHLKYWEDPPTPAENLQAGTPRTMYLMKGDGLVYVFEEQPVVYNDISQSILVQSNVNSKFYPNVFQLTTIKDRFGHKSIVEYYLQSEIPSKGRRWVKSVGGVGFDYLLGGRIVAKTTDGNYIFNTDSWGDPVEQNHRPNLYDMINPSGEKIHFGYEYYTRTGLFMRGTLLNSLSSTEVKFTMKLGGNTAIQPLYRLNLIREYKTQTTNGTLDRKYNYFPNGGGSINLSIEYGPENSDINAEVHSDLNHYKGQGRDLFFTNMLSSSTILKNGSEYRSEGFKYEYSANRSESDVWSHPVDYRDEYISSRTINDNSIDEFTYNTPRNRTTKKTYRNYTASKSISGLIGLESAVTSYIGSIKLMTDEYSVFEGGLPYKQVNYLYHITEANNLNPPGYPYEVASGNFLEKSIEEDYKNGAKKKVQYEYDGGGNINIKKKTEIDPLGTKTVTDFDTCCIWSYQVYKDGIFRFQDNVSQNLHEDGDSTRIYLNNIPLQTYTILPNSSTVIQKKIFDYVPYGHRGIITTTIDEVTDISNHNIKGYPVQLITQKEVDPSNNSILREISYEYYNKDTLGRHLYVSNVFGNKIEGNIKQITDAKGNKTKYYYNLISRNEQENFYTSDCYLNSSNMDEINCAPSLSYHKMYDDGTDHLKLTSWSDSRFPSRIDRYADASRYLSTYQTYDNIGNPAAIVNENKYISEAIYNKYYRLSSLTLPYDFNDEPIDTTRIPIQNTSQVLINAKVIAWGSKDEFTHDNLTMYDTENGLLYNANLNYQYTEGIQPIDPGGEDTPLPHYQINPYFQFDTTGFYKIVGADKIDSAFFEFSPYNISTKVNDVISNEYSMRILPAKILSYYNNKWNFTYGNGNITNTPTGILSSSECGDPGEIENQFQNNCMKFDAKNMLSQNFISNKLKLEGIKFDFTYTGESQNPKIDFQMFYWPCSAPGLQTWRANYAPHLKIYAQYTVYDTIKIVNLKNGTLIYNYDDINDSIQVMSKLFKSNGTNKYKRSTHMFDELGRLYKTKQYKDYNGNYNLFQTNYNYLDMKAKSTDARNLSTKFSYDKYNNLSETKNADESLTQVNSTFTTSSASGFTTSLYPSFPSNTFINIQEFTDETGRNYKKYFDAGGRLLRETKYVSNERSEEDGPFDPDSIATLSDDPGDIALNTDYRYDSLYRVNCVQTPAGKRIYYNYDKLGRQIIRVTPDAGQTLYAYDKNNNLYFSQDSKQRNVATNVYTFRSYDGLNRLLSIGESPGGSAPDFANLDPDTQFDSPGGSNDLLIVNVYDTLSTGPSAIFNNVPSGYYPGRNNTKGALVATAFRTQHGTEWNYKFYRYDARGRVIKMWTYIYGLGWKSENYYYDSQNKITANWYQPNQSDTKTFSNTYDLLGRLTKVSAYYGLTPETPEDLTDSPFDFEQLASYTYSENSQIISQTFKSNNSLTTTYDYNNRNWIHSSVSSKSGNDYFKEVMIYNLNGNIRLQGLFGSYKNSFSNTDDLIYTYTYDKSNRLVKADANTASFMDNTYDVVQRYDNDGNILSLKRYGPDKESTDDFTYEYISETNKLAKVRGGNDDYSYDDNGNLTKDDVNEVWDMKYDFRNLLVSCTSKNPDMDKPLDEPSKIYYTEYTYDEAGNRINKKVLQYIGPEIQPIHGNSDNPSDWFLKLNEYYVRNISRAEVATYKNTSIDYWNIWGTDNVGRIYADTSKQFYLKDHLGSIRCVLNSRSELISAKDLDCWGYQMASRNYEINKCRYEFTSKERDAETDYDYFGVRYYDSRIGRWGGVEPKYNQYLSYSSYSYVLNNPIKMIDIFGKDGKPIIDNSAKTIEIYVKNYYTQNDAYRFPLSDTKVDRLKVYDAEGQKKWNQAAEGNFFHSKDMKFTGYTVKFIFTEKEVPTGRLDAMVDSDPGSNGTLSKNVWEDTKGNKKYNVPAGTFMNQLAIYDFGNKPFQDDNPGRTGTHEIGHEMGLDDDYADGPNIMRSNNNEQIDPTAADVQAIIDKLDFNDSNKMLKGAISKPK